MGKNNIRVKHKRTEIWEELVKEHKVFDQYVELFVFMASLGHYHNNPKTNYKPDDDDEEGEMLWMHVSNRDLFKAVSAAIAYQHTGDADALINPELQLQVMAQYAVGGAEILEDELSTVKGDPTDAVLNYIQSHNDADRSEEEDNELQRILDSFDEDMMDIETE